LSKKSSGQLGHRGTIINMISMAVELLEYHPEYCNYYGKDLSDTSSELVSPYSSINVDDAHYKTLLIKKNENRKNVQRLTTV